jgi:hypothetical protein
MAHFDLSNLSKIARLAAFSLQDWLLGWGLAITNGLHSEIDSIEP